MKREKNYVVYDADTGETVSYHTSAALAEAKAIRMGRGYTYKRIA